MLRSERSNSVPLGQRKDGDAPPDIYQEYKTRKRFILTLRVRVVTAGTGLSYSYEKQ